MTTPVHEALEKAKALLSETTWMKGEYFQTRGETICMCAHGAVQAVVNPACSAALATGSASFAAYAAQGMQAVLGAQAGAEVAKRVASMSNAAWAADEAGEGAARAARLAEAAVQAVQAVQGAATTVRVAEGKRAAEAAKRTAKQGMHAAAEAAAEVAEADHATAFGARASWVRKGGLDAHYIMGMCGLTAGFNDDRSTTLPDVLAKFDEAVALAKELGV